MKKLTDKEYNEYKQMIEAKNKGRLLTPDGLKLICVAEDYDPEKIGIHFLNILVKLRNEGVVQ